MAGNFALIGSRMSSVGNSTIKVGGDSLIISQVNSEMEDSHSEYTNNGMIGDNDHVESRKSLTETLAGATITAGGKNVLINQGDQILQGATIHGGNGTFLKGRKTSMLATALRNMKSDFEYDEGTITNTTDSTGHDNTGHVHSNITGGGEQIIDSDIIESDFTRKTGEDNSDSIWKPLFADMNLNSTPLEHQKPSWAKKLEASGKSIKWNPVSDSSKSWDEHTEVLNPEFATIVSLAAAVGTMYAGGFGLFAAEGATATMGTTMGQAALTGLASTGSVSLINNNFDLGKTASDLASPDSLYNLSLNTLTAGLTFGIADKLQIGQIKAGMDVAQRATILAKTGAIGVGVPSVLSSGTGEKLGDIVRGETLSGGLALGQSVVGDIALEKGFKTGSAEKLAMHTLTGTAYSALTGGSAKNITTAANVGESALKYNRRLHPEELKYIKALQKGKTPEEQARYIAAALSLVEGDKGVNEKDPNYKTVKNITKLGSGYNKEQLELIALARADGNENAFYYSWSDLGSDFVSRNNEIVSRGTGGVKFGLGSIGMMASAGVGSAAAPVTGGASAVIAAGTGTASAYYAYDGYNQAFGTYIHSEGSKVLQSTMTGTDSFVWEKGKELAIDTGIALTGAAAIKGIGYVGSKTLESQAVQKVKTVFSKSEKSSDVVSKTSSSKLSEYSDSSSLYNGSQSTRIGISEIDRALKKRNGGKSVGEKKTGYGP